MHTTKKQFMRHLKRELQWRYSRKEYQEISNDYDIFFEEGCLQGKTETELCREFGDPLAIVMSLDKELHSKASIFRYISNYIHNAALVNSILLLTISIYVNQTSFSTNKAFISIFITTFYLIIVLVQILKSTKSPDHRRRQKANAINKFSSYMYFLSTLLTATAFISFNLIVQDNILHIPFGIRETDIGPIMALIMRCIIFFHVILLIIQSSNFNTAYAFLKLASIQYCATIISMLLFLNCLYELTAPSQYSNGLFLSSLPYIISLCVVYTTYFFNIYRRG